MAKPSRGSTRSSTCAGALLGCRDRIRRYIGDPHIGRQVRKIADEINSDDAELVAEEFARQRPKAHVGARRTKDALTAPQRVTEAMPAFTYGEPFEDIDMETRGKHQ